MPSPALRKLLPAWLATLCAAASAGGLGASSGTFACSYHDFGSCTEGSARVTLQEGKVQSVSFDSKSCGTKARPAARCQLEVSRSGPDKWAENGHTLSVTFAHPRYTELVDLFSVAVEDARIVLDFSDAQSITKCKGSDGKAAGELPERLVIAPRADKCQVEF